MTSTAAPFRTCTSEDGTIQGGGYVLPGGIGRVKGELREFAVPAGLYTAPPFATKTEDDDFTVEMCGSIDDELVSRLLGCASEHKRRTRRRLPAADKRKRRTRRRQSRSSKSK